VTAQEDVAIVDVAKGKRAGFEWILEESFEGWYLMHSKRTLRDIELVRVAMSSGKAVGLVMLKTLAESVGYVYYIAVAEASRKKGIGKLLVEDSLRHFKASKVKEVSEGFTRTSFGQVSKRYGGLHALNMYREMLVVPGEILLRKAIT